MNLFAHLFERLDSTQSTSEKVDAIAEYFAAAPAEDAVWALFILTGERLRGSVTTRVMREEAALVAGVPLWLLDECYGSVGDLSETLALLLPPPDQAAADLSLSRVMDGKVRALVGANEAMQRAMLREAWSTLDERARLIFHKLIRGGLRLGVQRKLVIRGLARAGGLDEGMIERRLIGGVKPTAAAFLAIMSREQTDADRGRPVPFMLANQLPTAHMDNPGGLLADISAWRAEWKYDGIRAQIVRAHNATHVWSRGEELIDAQFPEVLAIGRRLPAGAILDGEVLVWRGEKPAPFAVLQTYLNRVDAKSAQPGLFDTRRVIFMAFDILEHADSDLRASTLDERRAMLQREVERIADDGLRISPRVEATSWQELLSIRASARERNVEGLMLKHAESVYTSGRHRVEADSQAVGGWWKWKLDPYSVDAVLIHAQPGSGKRAGLYTDYTFGLWQERPGGTRELVTFAKAYSGLDQREIEEVDAFIRAHTTQRSGTFRSVEPRLVFEIGFEGVQDSTRHKSGVAVRFPRILRWRRDKTPEGADTIATLRAMMRT